MDTHITLLSENELATVSGGLRFDLENVHISTTSISGPHDSIEQTLSIGSQSSGAGAGKVTFNPF